MLKSRTSLILSVFTVTVLAWGCTEQSNPSTPPDSAAASDATDAGSTTAKTLPRETKPKRPRLDLSSRLPADNPFAEVFSKQDVFERVEALAKLLPTLGPDALDSVKAMLNGLNDGTQYFGVAEATLLIEFWSRREPEKAAIWAMSSSPWAYRGGLLVPAVETWAKADPQSAAAAILDYKDFGTSFGQPLQVALVNGWFDSGKPGLQEFIQGLGHTMMRQRMFHALAKRIAETQGAEAVVRMAEQLPENEPKFKLSAYRQSAKVIARREPSVALAWCEKICDGPYGDGVREMIAQHLAWLDGEAAMQWVSEMPEGRERDRTARAAFRGWWTQDREGFARWASGIREQGVPEWFPVEIFASGLARWGRPEEALTWVAEIEDEEVRQRTMTNVALIWRKQDQAAVDAWLETSPLSEEQREMVRNPVTRSRVTPNFPVPEALP